MRRRNLMGPVPTTDGSSGVRPPRRLPGKGGNLPNPFILTSTLAAKVGSILVHIEEGLSNKGHQFDWHTAETLLKDPDVQVWLAQLGPLVPRKR